MRIVHQTHSIIWAICLAFIFISCDNPNAPDCFQSAGEQKTISIHDYPNFNDLVIYDDISLIITEDDSTYFELSYYNNLIPEVSYSIDNDSLVFHNNNTCNFIRDYKSPTLIYHSSKKFNRIISLSSGQITNADTLRNPLSITCENISNVIMLSTANSSIYLSSNSSANFKISGNTGELKIASYFSDGKFDCRALICERANLLQRGYNDIIVHVSDSLVGSIENAGRVIYYGQPGIRMNIFGGGELIKATQ